MRFDVLLEPAYILAALLGGPGPQVCAAGDGASLSPASRAIWMSAPKYPAKVTAFVGVNVVPMDRERVLHDQTVLVEGGRITALGPNGEVQVPAGAVRIDGRGKYLMPGLADMHAHVNFPEPARTQAHLSGAAVNEPLYRVLSALPNGVTTIRRVGIGGYDPGVNHLMTDEKRRRDTTARLTTVPRVYLLGPLKRPATPDSVAQMVAEHKAAGFDFIQIPDSYTPWGKDPGWRRFFDSLMAAASRAGVPASYHNDQGQTRAVMLALGPGQGDNNHLHYFLDSIIGHGVSDSAEVPLARIRALAAELKRAGTWFTPTLNCFVIADHGENPRVAATRAWAMGQVVKALHDAGVGMLLASDGCCGVRESQNRVHYELDVLVRYGRLTPYQALRTGTYDAARYLRALDSMGTVAVGKRADLLLLAGNPLTDIAHAREPAGVMVGGHWLDRAALDQRLLLFPREWIEWEVLGGAIYPTLDQEQRTRLTAPVRQFQVLVDSLPGTAAMRLAGSTTPEPSPSERQRLEGVRQRLAETLGSMRTLLTADQRLAFDVVARVWLREQRRQGSRVTVPGITLP